MTAFAVLVIMREARRVNLADPSFAYDDGDPAGFRSGMLRMVNRSSPVRSRASLYELPPGEALCPYHYEYGEEEWRLVLQGRPSVRHPTGTEPLEPLDVVFFPPRGSTQVRNVTGELVRALMWSTSNGDSLSRQRQDRRLDRQPATTHMCGARAVSTTGRANTAHSVWSAAGRTRTR
jgi:hypothetical protein